MEPLGVGPTVFRIIYTEGSRWRFSGYDSRVVCNPVVIFDLVYPTHVMYLLILRAKLMSE